MLVFEARLDEMVVETGAGQDRTWSCTDGMVTAHGRTGEEALRRLVDLLEA